jgi:hypothetical protein
MSFANKTLKKILNIFSDSLIENDSKAALMKFSNDFPKEYLYFLSGIEIDLSKKSNNTDLLFSISNIGKDAFSVINQILLNSIHSKTFTSDEWQNLFQLIKKWKRNDYLNEYLENIWLEFDMSRNKDLSYSPGIFYGFNQNKKIISDNEIINFISKIDNKYKNYLLHLEKIPYFSNFSHFAVFHSRNTEILRLFFRAISIKNIIDLIFENNLKISEKNIFFIRKIESYFDIFSLHIDITKEKILDNIGIEAYLNVSASNLYRNRIKLIKELISEFENTDNNKLKNIIIKDRVFLSEPLIINDFSAEIFNIGIHHFKFSFSKDSIKAKLYYWYEGDWKT